jgi:hypothetical protein
MISGLKKAILFSLSALALVSSGTALAALSTEELTTLKSSGLAEDVIRFMIENGYGDVDRVVKLKAAGFSDETVATVIRSDLKAAGEAKPPMLQPEQAKPARPAADPAAKPAVQAAAKSPVAPAADPAAIMQTSAKVTIEQYLAVGDPIIQNGQDIPNATISLLPGRRLKVEWESDKVASTPGSLLRGKPFASPFHWDLDKGDALHGVNPKDNSFVLRTGRSHPGKPTAGKYSYWILHVTPDAPDFAKRIGELLAE